MSSIAELVKLPVEERLALIDELWVSLNEADIDLGSAQVNEVQARWRDLENDPESGLSYDELKARLG